MATMCIIWAPTIRPMIPLLVFATILMPDPILAENASRHVLHNYRDRCLNETGPDDIAVSAACEVFLAEFNEALEGENDETLKDLVFKYWQHFNNDQVNKNMTDSIEDPDKDVRFHDEEEDEFGKDVHLFGISLSFVANVADRFDLKSVIFVANEKQIRRENHLGHEVKKASFQRERGLAVSILPMREESLSSLCNDNIANKERSAVFVAHYQYNNHTIEFLKIASRENAISVIATPWFIFLKQDQTNLDPSELSLDINSEVYLCTSLGNNVTSIKEAYKRHSSDDEALVSPWGVWNGKMSELTVTDVAKWHRRRNLGGIHIKAATIHSPPYIYTSKPNSYGKVEITGFQADIWHELARICNFTYDAVLSRDGTWGRRLPNGSYNGMMGMLVDGEVEFLIADFYATEGRAAVGDFSVSVAYDTKVLLIRKGDAESVHWHAVLDPFTDHLWITALIMALVSSIVFILVHAIGNRVFPVSESEMHNYTYADTLFMVVFAFSQQGMKFEPTRNSTRVVFFVIYLTFLLLYEGFEAALFSTLTVKETSVTTLQTVYDDSSYKIGTIKGTATEYLLENGNHLHKKLYNERYSGVPNITAGVQRVLDTKDKYGLIFGDVPMVAVLSDQDLCEVEFVDAGYPRGQFVFVMQKEFPYKELFDFYLLKLRKSGWLDKLDSKWKRKGTAQITAGYVGDCGTLEDDKVVLGMRHLWAVFVFIFGSVAVSALIFLLEVAYHVLLICFGSFRRGQGMSSSTRKISWWRRGESATAWQRQLRWRQRRESLMGLLWECLDTEDDE